MKIKIAIFVKKWSEHAAKTRTEKNMIEVSDNYFIKTFFFFQISYLWDLLAYLKFVFHCDFSHPKLILTSVTNFIYVMLSSFFS